MQLTWFGVFAATEILPSLQVQNIIDVIVARDRVLYEAAEKHFEQVKNIFEAVFTASMIKYTPVNACCGRPKTATPGLPKGGFVFRAGLSAVCVRRKTPILMST